MRFTLVYLNIIRAILDSYQQTTHKYLDIGCRLLYNEVSFYKIAVEVTFKKKVKMFLGDITGFMDCSNTVLKN